ncbi:MAG TPA: ABC transporter substrate-binding protein [Beijerinckiaceae bacterium]|jgi:ABC-type nitrate/sulfonate/bicarbonate transport system substrate-binding protein|nr:ABC transporter substrate-binding protein [Beijerinckiaceae bacterium]
MFNRPRRTTAGRFAIAIGLITLFAAPAVAADKVRAGTSGLALLWTFIDSGTKAGIWQKYGIEVERVALAGDAVMQQALTSGDIQFGFGSGPGMGYHSKGVPAIGVAAVAGPPYSFMITVVPKSPIRSADDLKGRRIGVTTAGSMTQWLVRELSRQKGWGPNGIIDLPMGAPRTQLVAMKAGELDGTVTTVETTATYEEQNEARGVLELGELVKDFHTHVLFARTELIDKNPDLVARFLKGWFATVAYMKANKAFAIKESAAAMKYSESSITKAMDAQFEMLSDDGRWNPKAIDKISSSLVELGILEKEPPRDKLYTDRFVPVTP